MRTVTGRIDLISLRFGRSIGRMPPLGALSLASSLRSADIAVDVVDAQLVGLHPFAVGDFLDLVRSRDSECIGLSLFNDAIPLIIAAGDADPGLFESRRVLVGGPGVVGIARELMERCPWIDGIVVGEAESIVAQLVRPDNVIARQPGVFLRDDEGRVTGQGRTRREDLARVPPIDWSTLRGNAYSAIPLGTMRGCPFDCQFCEVVTFLGRQVTTRPLDLVMKDLFAATNATGIRRVSILDDTFTLNKKRVMAFCEALGQRRLDIEYTIFARADLIDRDMMHALASSGCVRVFVGVDGADDRLLARASKRITVAETEAALQMASEYSPMTASFIWGYPFESFDDFLSLLDFEGRLRAGGRRFPIDTQLHLLSPCAGTPIFERYGDRLFLDTTVPVLPIGGSIEQRSSRTDYDRVLRVIENECRLAAPFYRYDTPRYEEKLACIHALEREQDLRNGCRVMRFLGDNAMLGGSLDANSCS